MCRWGCSTIDTTYACKWCGTRFCTECLRGDFTGELKPSSDPKQKLACKKCKQPNCQGKRVEYVPGAKPPEETSKSKSGKKSAKGSAKKTKKSK